jgi:hypothetical protein
MHSSTLRLQIRVQHPTRARPQRSARNLETYDIDTERGGAPLRIRARDLLPRSEQHGLVPLLPLLRGVDRLEHELAVVHLLRGLGVEGDSVHDRLEILCEELSKESDFVEVRRHDMKVGAGKRDRMM